MDLSKLKVPALTAAAALMLAAPAGAQAVEVSQEGAPFTFVLPEKSDWIPLTPKEGSGLPSGFYMGKAPNAIMKLVFLPKMDAINTLPKAVAAFENELSTMFGENTTYKRLGAKEATYDGVKGKEIEYAVTGKANEQTAEARVRLWMGVGGQNVYAFQLIDQPSTYNANRDNTFAKVLKSVDFKGN